MKLFFLLFTLFSSVSVAQQFDLMQSHPSIKWKSIQNSAVRVVYPDYLGAQSIYIANMVEHYSHVVGNTYGIQTPEPFTLVIRTEVATPNGYVTLAPRRSEWFASSGFFPSVGATEWFQTLSIHEYRHVNQFDHFQKGGGVKILHYIMGDFGTQLAAAMSLPSWYLEGDAVWAETKYTDAGRGRSPRFLARLKALVQSGQIPTYDQFLSGTYQTAIPNQYVYGYVLISYGTQKYGQDIWSRVSADASNFPHPFRFYNSFQRLTGQKFEDFYQETMSDLKAKWGSAGAANVALADYRQHFSPFKSDDGVYSIRQSLDSHPTIVKEQNGKVVKVAEIPFSPEITQIQFGKRNAVLADLLPDSRYAHKSYSDLILVDLSSGNHFKITTDRMLYNPSFNPDETKILVVEFKNDQTWGLAEFDLTGKQLQYFVVPGLKFAEARYMGDNRAVALALDAKGASSIVEVDLKSKAVTKTLLPASRNLVASLFVDKNSDVLFEAQSNGTNQIFRISQGQIAQCSSSAIAAYTPSSDGENVFFSDVDAYGSVVKQVSVADCKKVESADLVDFKYLGDGPSDNYNKFPLTSFPNQEEMFTKDAAKYHPTEYGDFDQRFFVPHTWGLTIGRGSGLGLKTDNYLRTLGTSLLLGSDSEEGQSVLNATFDIKKYYPIFSFQVENRNRLVMDFATTDETAWTEKTAAASVYVPYTKSLGLYDISALLSGGAAYTDATEFELNKVKVSGSNYYYKTSSGLMVAWSKAAKPRSIQSPWLISYHAEYDNAEQPSTKQNSYRFLQEAVLQTPGIAANDGFKFTVVEQKQDTSGYRFLPIGATFDSYVFSRGYSYKSAPKYQKLSGNYLFPISYINLTVPRWFYLKRTYGTVFFDSTYATSSKLDSTLNSYGAEVRFDSVLLRFVPITFGGRVVQRLLDNEVRAEAFLATSVF